MLAREANVTLASVVVQKIDASSWKKEGNTGHNIASWQLIMPFFPQEPLFQSLLLPKSLAVKNRAIYVTHYGF